MTLNQIKRRLRKVINEDGWRIYANYRNEVRLQPPESKKTCCPITCLEYAENDVFYYLGEYYLAGANLRIPRNICDIIVDATDRKLKKINGLNEPLTDPNKSREFRKWLFKTFDLPKDKL